MKRILILAIAFSLVWQVGAFALAAGAKGDDAKSRAAVLIEQARAALGGEGKLKSIKSLSLSGSYRRLLGDRETAGEVEYEIIFPDKIRRSETMNPMPNVSITRIDVMNGDQIWSDSQSSGMGGMVMIRRPGENETQRQAVYEDAVRADFTRFLLSLLLVAPASYPLEFSFLGEAEAPDGRADAIGVSGPKNFNLRLFLDQKTHLPLLLSYNGRQPNLVMRSFSASGASREEIEKRAREDSERLASEAQASPEVEFQIALDDFRAVDGLLVPHTMTRSVDGKVTEELTLKKLKLNPSIKPQAFEKKGS